MALRSEVTVAPDGSHCETNANAGGSSGGETAPPEELLPSTTKNSQVGRIAQRPTRTDMIDANEATASTWSASRPQVVATGTGSRPSTGPATSVRTSAATTAKTATNAVQWRSGRPLAFARSWKTVMKPTIVATSIR